MIICKYVKTHIRQYDGRVGADSSLNQQNLKYHLSEAEKQEEGFVSWLYPLELLQQMHQLAPSIIVKDNGAVVGLCFNHTSRSGRFSCRSEGIV
jgi:hypothetical protein